MKTNKSKPMYKIDSCYEKIKRYTNNVCNQPSYHTVCNKPIVDRNQLTRRDHLNLLSTPKGFKWTGMKPYYKQIYGMKKWMDNNDTKSKR